MKYLYPLKLKYSTSQALWGGRRLIDEWGKTTDAGSLAETWELSVRDDGHMSVIENGEYGGATLREFIGREGFATVSDNYNGGRFPLIIKFIDAADNLSVQVHPDNAYADAVEHDSGKTEMWYIVDAEPGAEIILGLADGVTNEQLAEALRSGITDGIFNRVPVKRGDSFFIPAGQLHAIGRGVLVAEIQQNSDITYRVYDYGRLDRDGKPRELHVRKALDVIRRFSDSEIKARRFSRGAHNSDGCLADCRYFSVYHCSVGNEMTFVADRTSFHCLLSLGGQSEILCRGEALALSRGECVFIPAGTGEYIIRGKSEILLTTL